MKKFLVIGNPIDPSLSPKLHNFWIKKYNLDAIYGKLETQKNDLAELCEKLKQGQLNGLNVTVPFKKGNYSLHQCFNWPCFENKFHKYRLC